MAHNLATDVKTGEACLYLLKEKAWHGLGQVVEEAKSSEEVIKLAHLDWDVVKTPNFVTLPTKGAVPAGSFSIIRTDTETILHSTAKELYTPIQNIEAFKYMDGLVQCAQDIKYQTAGALSNGETTFVTAKLPGYIRITGTDDVIEKYLVFTNSHAGNALSVYFTDIRVVCNNTLSASMSRCTNKVSLKHTTNIIENLHTSEKMLNMVYTYNDKLTEALAKMAATKVNDREARALVNQILLTPEELKMIGTTDGLPTRTANDMNNIYAALNYAPGQEMHRGTALHVYNGLTSFYQNVQSYKSDDRKMDGLLLGGREAKTVQKAFDTLLALA